MPSATDASSATSIFTVSTSTPALSAMARSFPVESRFRAVPKTR